MGADSIARVLALIALNDSEGGGASSYDDLTNKPSINGVEIKGAKYTENYNLVDDSTIKVNSAHKEYVNIDNSTIVLNSEGKLSAKQQEIPVVRELKAGNAINVTKGDSEYTVAVKYDEDTIKLNSSGKLYADIEEVEIDNKTIIKGTDGKIKTAIGGYKQNAYLNIEGAWTYSSVTSALTHDLGESDLFIDKPDSFTAHLNGAVTKSGMVAPINTDATFTAADSSKNIYTTTLSTPALNVVVYGPEATGYYQSKVIITGCQGGMVNIKSTRTAEIQKVDNTFIAIDEDTIKVNADGNLYADIEEQVLEGNKPIVVDSENKINLLYDNDTLKINSEGKLYADIEEQILEGNKPIVVDSENKINLLYDNDTIKVDSEGKLYSASSVAIDEKTIVNNSEGKLSVPIDNKTIVMNSEAKISVVCDAIGIGDGLKFEDNTLSANVDSETIRINSEGRLYAVAKNLKANAPIIIDSEDKINLSITDRFEISSEGKLELADSEKYIKSETLVNGKIWTGTKAEYDLLNSEGKIDSNTLYNVVDDATGGVVSLPDNETLFIDSNDRIAITTTYKDKINSTDVSYICSTDTSESSVSFNDYMTIFSSRATISYGSIRKSGHCYQLELEFTITGTYTQDWKTTFQGTDLFNAICKKAQGQAYNTNYGGGYAMSVFYDGGSVRLYPVKAITETNSTWYLVMNWIGE